MLVMSTGPKVGDCAFAHFAGGAVVDVAGATDVSVARRDGTTAHFTIDAVTVYLKNKFPDTTVYATPGTSPPPSDLPLGGDGGPGARVTRGP